MLTRYLSLMLCLLLAAISSANSISPKVLRLGIYASHLNRFSDSNGIMWNDSLIVEIFQRAGFELTIKEYPARRLALTLNHNQIDAYFGSDLALGHYQSSSIRSTLPVSVVTWYIYYDHKSGWQPQWPPDAILRSKIGKSKQSSESLGSQWGLNISSSSSFKSIVKMVNLGRADYWLENASGLRAVSNGELKAEADGFTYKPLFDRPLFYYFNNDQRGYRLENIFHQGLKKLLAEGDYYRTYYKNDPKHLASKTVAQSLQYIRKHYPQVEIAVQKMPETVPKASLISVQPR